MKNKPKQDRTSTTVSSFQTRKRKMLTVVVAMIDDLTENAADKELRCKIKPSDVSKIYSLLKELEEDFSGTGKASVTDIKCISHSRERLKSI